MKPEDAIVLVIEIGSLFVIFLLLPLMIVLSRIRGVWRFSPGDGVVLTGVIVSTAFLFLLLFAGFAALITSGAP